MPTIPADWTAVELLDYQGRRTGDVFRRANGAWRHTRFDIEISDRAMNRNYTYHLADQAEIPADRA